MERAVAKLDSYRQSPRKVRVVANTVKGKNVKEAMTTLSFLPKRASAPLLKLIQSAVSNAKNANMSADDLLIKEMRVDGGPILYRRRSASRGRAPIVRKRTSHITVVLEKGQKKSKKEIKQAKKEAK